MKLNKALLQRDFEFSKNLQVPPIEDLPEKVVQFGEGNFLRAFVDWMIHLANQQGLFQGKVVLVQPIAQGLIEQINAQDGLYTLFLRGIQGGSVVERKEIISAISRGINPYTEWGAYLALADNPELQVVISNTTEAGIAYLQEPFNPTRTPASFPGKLTAFLYRRYTTFKGAGDKGLLILPCELIDKNGEKLKETILNLCDDWNLDEAFKKWVVSHNHFCNTLVDRIVTGYPRNEVHALQEELGYEDGLMNTGEIFHLWVIEGDASQQHILPLTELGLDVLWVKDLRPYRERKVRVLNGAHTMTVAVAHLCGIDTVKDAVSDPLVGRFMHQGIFQEILPHVPLAEDERKAFAETVLERFANPFIDHRWMDISLNSISKYKTRCLPTLIEYCQANSASPAAMSFALAALIAFYRGSKIESGTLVCHRDAGDYNVRDDESVLTFFQDLWKQNIATTADTDFAAVAKKVLGHEPFWGRDLNALPGLTDTVAEQLQTIIRQGMRASLTAMLEKTAA